MHLKFRFGWASCTLFAKSGNPPRRPIALQEEASLLLALVQTAWCSSTNDFYFGPPLG